MYVSGGDALGDALGMSFGKRIRRLVKHTGSAIKKGERIAANVVKPALAVASAVGVPGAGTVKAIADNLDKRTATVRKRVGKKVIAVKQIVATAPTSKGTATRRKPRPSTATQIVAAGANVNRATGKAASQVRALAAKAAAAAAAAESAAATGDSNAESAATAAADAFAAAARKVAAAANSTADGLDVAGGAAQGAATGAVAGAGSVVAEQRAASWFADNKPLVFGGLGLVGALALLKGGGASRKW